MKTQLTKSEEKILWNLYKNKIRNMYVGTWNYMLHNTCIKRLNVNNSIKHNELLNRKIRNYAGLLQIECPEEQSEFHDFVEAQVK